MSIKILLVDDHRVIRHGIRTALEQEPGIEVVAEADNGRSAVVLTRTHRPDIVLMDIEMPDMNGIEATRQIIAEHPDVKVIALSMLSHKRHVMGMLEAGAVGFLPKNCSFDELTRAICEVVLGRFYLSADVARVVVKTAVNPSQTTETTAFSLLTTREREVVQLVAEGHSNKTIADRLSISVTTVESHRRQLTRKLNLRSVAELTKFAIREGLTSLET